MNKREDAIFSFGVEYLKPRFCENEKLILQNFKKNKPEIIRQMEAICEGLFEKAAQADRLFSYLCICPLQSGIITKTYDVQFSLHDETCFADRNDFMTYWTADFIYQYLEADIESFAKEVRKKVVRVTDGEIQEFRLDYACNYHMLLQEFFAAQLAHIEAVLAFIQINKTAEFQIVFGHYMSAVAPLKNAEREEAK